MTTKQESKLPLSQTASWNPRLTNPYRTRWATRGGRFFQIESKRMRDLWMVSEVTVDGEWIPNGFGAVAFTLAEARQQILDATDE
jgi:hypothetical protein